MKFNRFLGRIGKKKPLHTNAMAEVAAEQGRQSSAESFEKRRATDNSRQFVRQYGDSKVVAGYQADMRTTMAEMAQRRNSPTAPSDSQLPSLQSNRQLASSSKLDIVKPSRQGYNASPVRQSPRAAQAPPRHSFTEPRSRYR